MIKKAEAYKKFVFVAKQQMVHVNGLTYDFLYGMAKELEEAEAKLAKMSEVEAELEKAMLKDLAERNS